MLFTYTTGYTVYWIHSQCTQCPRNAIDTADWLAMTSSAIPCYAMADFTEEYGIRDSPYFEKFDNESI